MNKIGNIEIKNKLILAPMAGITNEAFFYVAKEHGAGLLYSEMVSDKGLLYHNQNTLDLLKFNEELHPFAVQIFGSDKKELAEAAKIVKEIAHPDIIDINMGCSVPKVYRNNSGSALLKNPEYVYEIVKEVREAVNIPITIKIRSGIDHKHLNYVEVGKAAERAGASAIAIHPRTKSDLFRGKANWDHIKKLKDEVSIPVIGSGDIKNPIDAKRMLDETGCDFLMIGRAAMGNPFIFDEINEYLETGSYKETSIEEKFNTMFTHLEHLINLKGEKTAILEMRSHAAWYVKGLKESAAFKRALNQITTKEELVNLINEYKNKLLKK